ncbi:hypothetical protein A6M21_05060 [Desulfotomaculum copahuensis]|uniref:Probable membrane transporter protein n=2 Tax=Desulfotomaculum copahuensis TaxID=1838280 RepID=A0A1B7LI93_9FIRM|nr:hypothetical protein A6M21_05060 [Desulfotomaculum copahuensis]
MFKRFISGFWTVGEMMTAGVKAEAKWEYEMGKVILGRRKKMLFLALLPVILGVGVELAMAGTLPDTIGGSKAYMPTFVTSQMFIGSIFVGLMAGLITGCIGAGGGYVLTPALMSIGVRGIMSVGTDQFHLFAKAIMGTVIHKKLGNVNLWMAVWFVVGSLTGVTVGATLNRAVYAKSPALSDAFISLVYVVILGILGAYSLYDWIRLSRTKSVQSTKEATTAFAKWLQGIPLKPRVTFDQDIVAGGRSISIYPLIIVGFIVGMVASVMGVGGGFLTFPIFVYGLGVSTFTTVGTDILQIIFTTGYSSVAQYAIYGYVFYSICMGMLLGSLVGVQLGALVTKYVKGSQIRAFYALTILAGFVNRICALPGTLTNAGYLKVNTATGNIINQVGNVVFFVLVAIFSVWILIAFFQNAGKARAAEMSSPVSVER